MRRAPLGGAGDALRRGAADDGLLTPAPRAAVALVGVGRIGSPIARRLAAAGNTVRVFDTDARAAHGADAAGARVAASASEAAAGADTLITALPGNAELRAVMLGSDSRGGLLAELDPGTTWIDVTSADPQLGVELSRAAAACSIAYLDAPLGGGVDAARNGTLALFVGGDPAVLDTRRALLSTIAAPEKIYWMGAPGSGYLTKLMVNALWFGQVIAGTEVLLLAQRSGIALDRMHDVIMSSAGAGVAVGDLAHVLRGDYLPNFGIDRCVEELDSLVRHAQRQGAPFELGAHVAGVYRAALDHFGAVDGELLAAGYLEHRAGTRLRVE